MVAVGQALSLGVSLLFLLLLLFLLFDLLLRVVGLALLALCCGLGLGWCVAALLLASLLQLLLADDVGCTIGVDLNIAALILALELADGDSCSCS